MLRQGKTALFELIDKLDKNEKRYLTLHLGNSVSGYNIYYKLFRAVSDKNIKDNKTVLETLPEIKAAQLPNLKTYLYHQILKLLKQYQSNKDIESEMHDMLEFIRTLYNKGLTAQCRVILKNAIALCEKHELYLYRSLLSEWEMRLQISRIEQQRKQLDIETETEKARNIFRQKKEAMKNYSAIAAMELLQQEVFIHIREDRFSRKPLQIQKIESLIEEKALLSKKPASFKSFKTGFLYHNSLAIYHITAGHYQQSYTHFRAVLDLFERFPFARKNDPGQWSAALYNFILNCMRIYRFDEHYYKAMQQYESLLSGKSSPAALYCLQLVYYSTRGEFSAGLPMAKNIESKIRKGISHDSVFIKLDLYFDLMYIYFGSGNYEAALTWLNKILIDKAANKVTDLYSVCLLIQLVLHYELKNTLILDSLLRSAQRFLKQKSRKYRFEAIFLSHMAQLANVEDEKARRQCLKSLHKAIKKLEQDPYESRIFEYLDFPLWVKSKIKKDSFEQLAQKQYSKLSRQKIAD
ncbi:MAG: hypothetical protein WD426_13410 [Anditalea sp.]